jgi:hypothetical protein
MHRWSWLRQPGLFSFADGFDDGAAELDEAI